MDKFLVRIKIWKKKSDWIVCRDLEDAVVRSIWDELKYERQDGEASIYLCQWSDSVGVLESYESKEVKYVQG